jgi:hypothetical protein
MRNRMREIRTSGSVRGGDGNIPTYSACRQDDFSAFRERLEPGITVDLQDAAEPVQMSRRPLRLAVRAVEVDGGRRIWPRPGAVVTHIDPEPPGLGSAAAGIKHGNGRVVGEQLG